MPFLLRVSALAQGARGGRCVSLIPQLCNPQAAVVSPGAPCQPKAFYAGKTPPVLGVYFGRVASCHVKVDMRDD